MNFAGESKKVRAIILAAGKGTRMKSDLAKVLHPLCGRPMLGYVVETAREAGSEEIVVVIGHQAPAIEEKFRGQGLVFVEQKELLGTGHAVLQTQDCFRGYDGAILILCGDVPLLRASTVKSLYRCHIASSPAVTVLTALAPNPRGYGRIVKGPDGAVLRIVEERDASEEERKIQEINTGIYCVESRFLFKALGAINNDNAQGEYYLTDIVSVAFRSGLMVRTLTASDMREVMGINSLEELQTAQDCMEIMLGGGKPRHASP